MSILPARLSTVTVTVNFESFAESLGVAKKEDILLVEWKCLNRKKV